MKKPPTLTIDPEFKTLIPPLQPQERTLLEASIKADGCRDPIVAWNHDGKLIVIDGHNRFEICTANRVSYKTTEMRFDERLAAKIWIVNNQFARRNLTDTQRMDLALALEPLIAARGKEHQRLGGRYKASQNSEKPVDTYREVAKLAGVSHDTIAKYKIILDRGSEEAIRELRKPGSRTSVHKEYKRIIEAKIKTDAIAKVERAKLEPNGKYDVQIADFAWPYELKAGDPEHRGRITYPAMTMDEIIQYAQAKILPFFEDNAIFWCWTTNAFMHDAYHVCDAIGFDVKTILTWARQRWEWVIGHAARLSTA